MFKKDGFEGRVELAHDHGDNRQGAWGVQMLTQDFSAEGEEAYIEPVTTQDWGLFVTERWIMASGALKAARARNPRAERSAGGPLI
ncbi:MAG: hypothetical protein JKP95_01100 [Oceanicaulis sp.]|nr:hypothetical protein [Oceanicaulis sp.]